MKNTSEQQLTTTGRTPVALTAMTNISGIWLSINFMVLASVLPNLAAALRVLKPAHLPRAARLLTKQPVLLLKAALLRKLHTNNK